MGAGILLVDKPQGLTSHDVVARIRRLAGTRKVGHAGTLDPMATGLLVIGIDSATRLLHYIVGLDKEYVATIRLGQSSTTDDAEGELSATASADAMAGVTTDAIERGIAALTGSIEQVPSSVSAIKVDGERAYAKVRAGETVELAARPVTIHAFALEDMRAEGAFVDLDVRVTCSSGTYIRALARDLGADLGVGGHLTMLRRTRIGAFDVADGQRLDDLLDGEPLRPLAPATAAKRAMPVLQIDDAAAIDLGHGKRLPAEGAADQPLAAAVTSDGRLVAIVERRSTSWKVATGFPAEETA